MSIRLITGPRLTLADVEETVPFSERYFGQESDPAQLQTTPETTRWVWKNISSCLTIIRDGPKLVGFTFMFPCTQSDMNAFLTRRISENDLFQCTRRKWGRAKMNHLYYCSSLISPKYRRLGLIFLATKRMIAAYRRTNVVHSLFSDPFSRAGKRLGEKVSRESRVPMSFRQKSPSIPRTKRNTPPSRRRR